MTEEQCKKLKVGDKVRCCVSDFVGYDPIPKMGEIGVVSDVRPLGVFVNFEKAGKARGCSPKEIELIPRPFKVGDRVRKIADYGFEIGKTGRIKVIEGEKYGLSWDDGEYQNDKARYTSEELELVEPVKEEKYVFDVDWGLSGFDFSERIKDQQDLLDKVKTLSLTTRTMRKLSELSASVRRAFSPEQRKLYKAGFIDSCGKYTDAAKDEVLNVLCDEHKEKLVEFAKEAIETAKEDKEDDE